MRIIKFKLQQGTYPFVTFSDGNVEVTKNYPSTEAPPKMIKAMMAFNSHVTELTEQYDATGQHDYDQVVMRSYSIKGEGDKEGIILTGIRTLANGGTLLLNTKSVSLDTIDSTYPKIGQLLVCLENLRTQIESFMKSNPSTDDIQGKLAFTKPDNVVVESEESAIQRRIAAGEAVDVTDLYAPSENGSTAPLKAIVDKVQEEMDIEMPLTLSALRKAAKVRTLTTEEQENLQRLNADENARRRIADQEKRDAKKK